MRKGLLPKNKYIIFSKALGTVLIEIKKTYSTFILLISCYKSNRLNDYFQMILRSCITHDSKKIIIFIFLSPLYIFINEKRLFTL